MSINIINLIVNMNRSIMTLVITAGVVAISYLAYISVGNFLKMQAVKNCLAGGNLKTQITSPPQVQTFTQPDGGWYETCMRDMGYRGKK